MPYRVNAAAAAHGPGAQHAVLAANNRVTPSPQLVAFAATRHACNHWLSRFVGNATATSAGAVLWRFATPGREVASAHVPRPSARTVAVIVSLHVATGAAAGAATGSRLAAVMLGPILHLAGDRLPHQDIGSRRFEIGSSLAALVLLAARRGPVDPATLGAAASSAPDLEHVLPFLRPGGSKLFHGRRGWHRSGRFPADLQLLLAGAILGALITPRKIAD